MEDTSKIDDNVQNQDENMNIDPTAHVSTSCMDDQQNANPPEDLDNRWLRWKCAKCGYLYEGVKELKKCPRCGNEDPDCFQDAD